ncbi:MAG TPA: FMN-binding protein [Thermoanaerobaculia bacterium]|nr:FMN-binding protein [Thermoanaerobaculia bacterium]
MSPSATPSERRLRRALAGLALLGSAAAARAAGLLSQEEALKLAFPGCQVQRETVFLTPEQKAEAGRLAGTPVESGLVYPYRATCAGVPGGSAYFDTHRVRTQPETLMVVVTPEGKVGRLEVVAFAEPPEYLPRAPWYRQFDGDALGSELELGRGVRAVTGATLTARATTEAVRRILALHQVLGKASPP